MKTMNKKERRQAQLTRHYAALVRLAEACGVKKADGKKLSVALRNIEQEAHKGAECYCNGENMRVYIKNQIPQEYNFNSDENAWDDFSNYIERRVQELFNGKLPFLHINGDARGYALKIDDEKGHELIKKTGLQRDWGGYGLLAPEITGD